MKTIKSWQWKRTEIDEYKEILGFDNLASQWKIDLKFMRYNYSFVPKCGEIDNVTLFSVSRDLLVVYAESVRHGYATVYLYALGKGNIAQLESCHHVQSDYDFMDMFEMNDPEKAVNRFFAYSTMHKAKLLLRYCELSRYDTDTLLMIDKGQS